MHPLPMLIDWAIGVVVEQNLQAMTIMVHGDGELDDDVGGGNEV